MISESKGLSSPSLVRKASVNKSSGDTLRKVQTQVYPDFSSKPMPDFSSNYSSGNTVYNNKLPNSYSYSPSAVHKRDPIDDIFTTSALNAQPLKRDFREEYYREDVKKYDPIKRSLTEGTIRRSPEKNYKTSNPVVTSPYSDSESLSPPGPFRNNTKSPEFHES